MPYNNDDDTIVDVCDRILGSAIEGLDVDPEEESVYIYTTNGTIRVEGYDLRLYIETERFDD